MANWKKIAGTAATVLGGPVGGMAAKALGAETPFKKGGKMKYYKKGGKVRNVFTEQYD
jgi:hypothetical protein